jgi:hypothetical protein
MDANEMAYEFDVLFDKIASFESPGYTNREKSVFLSKAQEIFVDKYYTNEYTERRRRDFSTITRHVDITTTNSSSPVTKPNATLFQLPSDMMYVESEEVTISHTTDCFDAKRIIVLPIREDEYALKIHDPFKRPSVTGSAFDCAWRLDWSDGGTTDYASLVTDGTFTLSTYHLTYIKTPEEIVPVTAGDTSTTTQSDCELNTTSHREIVEIAVRIAAGVTTPQEYQIKLNEENINN